MAFYIGEILKLRGEFLEAHQKGDYLESIVLGKKIMELYKNNNDCDSMEYAVDLHNLGIAYDDICMYEKAIFYYRSAAELKKKLCGESISYADTLNNLAIAYSNTGKHDKALKLQKKVLHIRDTLQGKNHTDYMVGLFNLGNAYEDVEDYSHSLEMHTKALVKAHRQKDYPKEDYADILISIGRVYEKMGNYNKTLESYEEAIDIIRKMNQMEHYRMTILMNAAAVAEKAERLKDAVCWCEEAVGIRKKVMSISHLDYISNMNTLAALYSKSKDFQKALDVHEQVLETVEKILGKNHAYYADVLNNIGVDYNGMKQYHEAIRFHQQALDLKKAAVGKTHPQYALSLVSMGAVYLGMGKFEDALQCYQEALEIRNVLYHGDSVACADILIAIANLYQQQKEYDRATKYYFDAMLLRKRLGETKDDVFIWNLQSLGKCYIYAGNKEEGIACYQQAIEIQNERYGAKHPRYASSLRRLGKMYASIEEYQSGIALLKEAVTIEEEMLGEKSPRYWDTLLELARLYMKQGEVAKAIELLLKVERMNALDDSWIMDKRAVCWLYIAKCYLEWDEKEKSWQYYQKALESQREVENSKDGIFDVEAKQFLAEYQSRKWQPNAAMILKKNSTELEETLEPIKIFDLSVSEKKEREQKRNDKLENKIKLLLSAYDTLQKSRGSEDVETVEAAIALGDAYYECHKLDDALFWYQKAEKHGSEKVFAQCCLKEGALYLQNGNYRKALEKLTNAKRYIEEYDSINTQEYIEIISLLKELYQVQEKQRNSLSEKNTQVNAFEHSDGNAENESKNFHKTTKEYIEYYSKLALILREEKGETLEYARLLLKTAELYCNIQKDTEAIVLFQKAAALYCKKKGEKSIAYGRILER